MSCSDANDRCRLADLGAARLTDTSVTLRVCSQGFVDPETLQTGRVTIGVLPYSSMGASQVDVYSGLNVSW